MTVFSILIVDDNATLRECLSMMVTDISQEVWLAENGEEAAKIVSENRINLIITDTNMPVMNGIEFLRFSKKHSPEIPVIVMFSGLFSDPTITAEQVAELGALAVLEKGEGLLGLNEVVNGVYRNHMEG